jgi:cyclopropane fatty-acyl-phospholipid synthase-like methyltransferase
MQYDLIKKSVGRFFSGTLIMRKILYALLDLLLLRAWHVKKSLKKISRQLPYNATVLDAGSGFGQYTWRMSRMKPEWKINAVDIDSEHVKDCSRFFEKAGLSDRVIFSTGDLATLSDADTYNLILSVDVMEHIEDDTRVFRNFFKSLKNNGILLISTPSDKGGSDVHNDGEESFIDEHVRDGYSRNDITEKLSEAGFKSIDASFTYGKPGNISWRLSMKYPVRILNQSKFFFIILPFYYLICFPIVVILNFMDLSLTHKTGTGLIIIARK